MHKTIRKSFIKGDLIITYSNPSIQAYSYGKRCETDKDICYFYYDVHVLYKGKILMEYRTHDFPKIDTLSKAIDNVLSDDNFLLENECGEKGSYHRFDYFKRIKHIELFEIEYGYVFNVDKCVWKQADETEYNVECYYEMEIFSPKQINNRWYDEHGEICTTVKVKMSKEELIQLKQVAEGFMEEAIEQYNGYVAKEN